MRVQDILTAVMDKVVKPLHQRFTGNNKGDLSGLKTQDKSSFVAAVNELKDQLEELRDKIDKIQEDPTDKKKEARQVSSH